MNHSSNFCKLGLLVVVGLFVVPTISSAAYTKNLSVTTTSRTHTFRFTGLPRAYSNVSVKVDLYGDYNGTTETATVKIGSGSNQAHAGGGAQCNTNVAGTTNSKNSKTFTVASTTIATNGTLTVVVTASTGVSTTLCPSDRVVVTLTYTSRPDLTVSFLSSTSTTVTQGGTMNVRYRIRNIGGETATSVKVRFYLSTNTTISTGDTYLNHERTVTLAAGVQTGIYSVTVTIPKTAGGTRYLGAIADYDRKITEISESNNTLHYTRAFAVRAPDLQISSFTLSGSTTVGQGQSVLVRYRVRNGGVVNATGVKVRFYISTNTTISTADTYLNVERTYNLNAGQSLPSTTGTYTLSLRIPAKYSAGTRYLGVFIDYNNQYGETSETNNTANIRVTVAARPDLEVSALTVTPTTIDQGGTATVRFTVRNSGSATSGTAILRLYASTNSTITTIDTYLNVEQSVTGLAVNATRSYVRTIRLPANYSVGTRWIGAIVDYNGRVTEQSESNNTRAAQVTVKSATTVDLQVVAQQVSPTTTTQGGTVTLRYRLRNNGNTTASSAKIRFYFSTNNILSTGDTYLNVERTFTLSAGQTLPGTTTWYSVTLRIPANASTGTRYIGALIDWDRKFAETNESNNYVATPITVNRATTRDLVVSSLTVSPLNPKRGGTVSVSFRIRNLGTATSGSFNARIYSSSNSLISTGDTYLNVQVTGINLTAGAQSTLYTRTVTIPTNTPFGPRWIGVYADSGRNVTESDETNNGLGREVQITDNRPDLKIEFFNVVQTSVNQGGSVTVQYRIYNAGGGTATNAKFRLYLSTNSSIGTTTDTYLNHERTLTLGAGARSSTYNVSVKIPPRQTVGTNWIGGYIDWDRKIAESNESNNIETDTVLVKATPTIELELSTFSLSKTTGVPGDSIVITYRLRNNGNATSGTFKTRFYYALNSTLTSGVVYLNHERSITLAGGALSTTYTHTIQIPAGASTTAAGYIGGIVDWDKKIAETDETNNVRSTRITVTQPKKADLVAVSVKLTPVKQLVGQTVKVDYEIKNNGAANTAGYAVRVYWSKNSTIDATDTPVSTFTLGALNAGQTVKNSVTITTPTVALGSGFIGMWVDYTKVVAEDSESNNTTATAFTGLEDKDKDGVPNDVDCNDNDKTIFPAFGGKPGATEVCNGKDNDCNKKIDDIADAGKACTDASRKGVCQAGTWACVSNTKTCKQAVQPTAETCNGKDNNCDGTVDNIPDAGQSCTDASRKGECQEGTWACVGNTKTCKQAIQSSPETCDGKDNDCDGSVDNQAGGNQPLERTCTTTCGTGKETCQSGAFTGCTAPTSCEPGPEPKPEVAAEPGPEPKAEVVTEPTPDAGVEPRSEVVTEPTTDAGTTDAPVIDQPGPDTGDCYVQGCPTNQICSQGTCIADPCQGVNCPSGEFCRSGLCIKACGCLKCASNEVCVDGQCQSNPCAGVNCTGGQVCDKNTGNCIADACATVKCAVKRVCLAGKCVDDPCNNIQCLPNQTCNNGQCVGTNCPASEQTGETTGEVTGETSNETTSDETDAGTTDSSTNDTSGGDTNTNDTSTSDTTTTDDPVKTDESKTDDPGTTDTPSTTDATVTDKSENTDKGSGGDRGPSGDVIGPPEGGCGCSVNGQPLPLFLLLALFAVFVINRRRK